MVKKWPECIAVPRTINASAQHQAGFVPFSTFSCVLSIFRRQYRNTIMVSCTEPEICVPAPARLRSKVHVGHEEFTEYNGQKQPHNVKNEAGSHSKHIGQLS